MMANRRSAILPAPAQQPRIMVAVDFGTTFSGIAWANTASVGSSLSALVRNRTSRYASANAATWDGDAPDHHCIVRSWGDDLPDGEKAPTVIRYRQSGSRDAFEWGFQVTENPKPGVKYHEWFKLGLCPETEIGRKLDTELPQLYKSTTALPPGNSNETKRLVITYLKCLNKRLGVALGPGLAQFPREYIITVPAIWTHGAQELTRECAQKAGMGEGNKIEIISEPEAASIYAIQTMENLGLEKDDTFVLCDAGGGTVDLASFTIETRTPYINLAGAGGGGSGGLCGSSFLNRIFDSYLRAKLQGYSAWTDRLHIVVLKEFENRKQSFAGTRPFRVHIEGHHSDNPQHGITDSLLEISAAELKSKVFTPVIDKIKTLVRSQIDKTVNDGTPVKAVLLAGGFGKNPFLRAQLQEMVGSAINVTVVENSNTAIVRGALIAGLAGQLGPRQSFNVRVSARPASYHYGTQCFEPYDANEHKNAKDLKEDDGLGGYQIYINRWIVDKSKLIKETDRKDFKFDYIDKHEKRVPEFLPFKIYTCDTDRRPPYAKQRVGNRLKPHENVHELVEISIPLSRTKAINRQVETRNGTKVTIIPFRVEMRLKNARLIFTIFLGEKEPQELEPQHVRFESSNDLVQNDNTDREDDF